MSQATERERTLSPASTGSASTSSASTSPASGAAVDSLGGGEARSWRVWRWVPIGVGAAALGVLALRDPNQSGSYGFCPLHALTGLDCPFCGGLRGTYALLHGDVATALDHNLLLPLYLGVFVAVGVIAFRGTRAGGFGDVRSGRGRLLVWGLVAVTTVFFVVRNLPWFPYLDARA